MKYVIALLALLWVAPANAATTRYSFDFVKTQHDCYNSTGLLPTNQCSAWVGIDLGVTYSGVVYADWDNRQTAGSVTCDFGGVFSCYQAYLGSFQSTNGIGIGDGASYIFYFDFIAGTIFYQDDFVPDSDIWLDISNVVIEEVPLPASALLLILSLGFIPLSRLKWR